MLLSKYQTLKTLVPISHYYQDIIGVVTRIVMFRCCRAKISRKQKFTLSAFFDPPFMWIFSHELNLSCWDWCKYNCNCPSLLELENVRKSIQMEPPTPTPCKIKISTVKALYFNLGPSGTCCWHSWRTCPRRHTLSPSSSSASPPPPPGLRGTGTCLLHSRNGVCRPHGTPEEERIFRRK